MRADELCALAFEEPRGFILLVAELGDGGLDLLAGRGSDGRMVAEDAGDGHQADTSELSYIADRWSFFAFDHAFLRIPVIAFGKQKPEFSDFKREVCDRKARIGPALRTSQRPTLRLP